MHGGVPVAILILFLVGIPALALAGTLGRARTRQAGSQARGGIISGWLAHRRALRLRQVDHENSMRRERFRSALRIREQAERERRADARRARRAARGKTVPGEAQWTDPDVPGAATGGTAPQSPRDPLRPRDIRLRPEQAGPGFRFPWPRGRGNRTDPGQRPPGASPPGPGSAGSASGSPGPSAPPQPPVRGAESALSPGTRPAPGRPEPGPIIGVVVTTPAALAVPGLEDILAGLDRLYAYARSGNAIAKRQAALGLNAIGIRAATVSQALARAMSEPDSHYGPECTEPLGTAAVHFRVGASAAADSEAAIASIIRAMRELEGRQVPHYSELQETGGR